MSDFFSPENTAKAVHATLDAALLSIPPDKKSAVLIDATGQQVQALFAVKAGQNWTIAGGALYDGRHVSGQVAVMGSWD